MSIFTVDNVGLVIGIASLLGSLPAYKGYLMGASALKGSWQLTRLRNELQLLTKLKDSEHELTYFLAVSVLVPIALLGVSLVFHAAASLPADGGLGPLSDWLIGSMVYIFCAYRLGKINRLRKFDENIERLQSEITVLEAKVRRYNEKK